MPQTQLSEILRVERARRDLGLVEASKEIGINKETLARLEKGLGNPYYPTIKRLADYYGFPVQDLLVASTIEEGDEEVEEGDSPKAEAPTSPQPGEDTERRVTELERRIEDINCRAQAWEQQVSWEENPFLVAPDVAAAWDAAVAKEVAEITEAAEKAARSLIEESTEGMLIAQELQKLEGAYSRLWEVSRKVTDQVNEVVVGEGKARLARAREEREREFQAMEEWLSSAEAEAVRRS